ncbi:hypothetical protein [Soonwooa sp.]|uniref:hypothetical protein n=1 Tax=Soonwooa sp. TaxID=1938592 RepID=UPI0028A8EDFB|nr:hypothetical protein [Soonwooa sp.]
MRLSNKKRTPIYNFIQTILFVGIILGMVAFFVERYKIVFLGWESYLLIVIPVFIGILYWTRGKQIFEYDSDGETLTINNYSIVPFFKDQKKDEFPKYKLQNFQVVNLIIIKRLLITIHSKKNHHLHLKYDVSYLRNKEVKDLKISLRKVLKANKEENQVVTETV